MHPRNVPIAITLALLMGAALTYSVMHNGIDVINLSILLIFGACCYILSWIINKRDVTTADDFRITLNGIEAELHAHRQDHDIRAYDPKNVGMQVSALTAAIIKLDVLVRDALRPTD